MNNQPTCLLKMKQHTTDCQTQCDATAEPLASRPLMSWDDLPLCFGVETLAFIMGCSIGKARDICKNGGLCWYKEGKRYIIFKQDLRNWLAERRKNLKRAKIA